MDCMYSSLHMALYLYINRITSKKSFNLLFTIEKGKNMENSITRAFLYVRVSTNEQAEKGYSIQEQESHLRSFCDAMNWKVVSVYNDAGWSGGNMERPALQEMIRHIKETDVVLVDKLDRLSRSQFDTLYLIRQVFTPNEVAFVSRSEAFDTSSPFGRAMVGILAVFAELERERIKERMSDGRLGRAKKGLPHGAVLPTGYERTPDGNVIINEYEAMQVKMIFDMMQQEFPYKKIADELNNRGYTRRGNQWNSITLPSLLTNPIYIGKVKLNGQLYDGLHEPIISEEQFYSVQDKVLRRKQNIKNRRTSKEYGFLLGGLVKCSSCGVAMYGNNIHGYKYYSCRKHSNEGCTSKTWRAADLESIVMQEIAGLKLDYNSIDESSDLSSEVLSIQNEIDKLEKKRKRATELYMNELIGIDELREHTEKINKEIRLLNVEIDRKKTQVNRVHPSDVRTIAQAIIDSDYDVAKTNQLLSILIDFIELKCQDIEIHWNI